MSEISKHNVDQFKQQWESDNQWAARQRFILAFRDTYSVARLLCLSQVYANIENLGCKYPSKVMIEVEELAKALKAKNDDEMETEALADAVPCYYTANS